MYALSQKEILSGIAGRRHASPVDVLGHSSVQPWSAGELFPCIIGYVERYPEGKTAADDCAPSVSWELTAYGHSEEYATREDAEEVAQALNASATLRAAWTAKAKPTADAVAVLHA